MRVFVNAIRVKKDSLLVRRLTFCMDELFRVCAIFCCCKVTTDRSQDVLCNADTLFTEIINFHST